MGPLVNKGEIFQQYALMGETVTKDAKINAFFTITEDGKQGAIRSSSNPNAKKLASQSQAAAT